MELPTRLFPRITSEFILTSSLVTATKSPWMTLRLALKQTQAQLAQGQLLVNRIRRDSGLREHVGHARILGLHVPQELLHLCRKP